MKPSSYDILGSKEKAIAIIEEMENPKEAAKAIMEEHKNIRSVLMKLSERKGVERKREYELVLGGPNTEVVHKENYCRFKLDPQKVYFSTRESTERLRIAEMVEPGETVMVMFAGVGPFSILIAKKQPDVEKIPSIEINPDAVKYMKENIRLNKVEKRVIPILGDVREQSKLWFNKCDRVVMPLPHDAEEFLNLSKKCIKPGGGIIHLYIIEREDGIKGKVEEIEENLPKGSSYSVRKVLPYAPRTYKYCMEIQLTTGNFN